MYYTVSISREHFFCSTLRISSTPNPKPNHPFPFNLATTAPPTSQHPNSVFLEKAQAQPIPSLPLVQQTTPPPPQNPPSSHYKKKNSKIVHACKALPTRPDWVHRYTTCCIRSTLFPSLSSLPRGSQEM
ncbi:uncharacterized protein K444DRAFT_111730 [Hyaloscypha bicolor E]|uniref:Uncharacterized protein n=1 Tax=Hyaloscypha bicolor E TaxID=1095630 RepID=A0A2J6SVB9_9HELO|nr:uncharacterized protein K444DRAFT_111730 [Hyaloscypha bicolor E]PMD54714.1 hypothetical protein K444DRAFT_111730 [Hyaloscypha bicolor E]